MESKKDEEKESTLRQQKSNNVIIFNIPESEGEPEEAIKEDVRKLKNVLKDQIEIKPEDIKTIFRKQQSNENKRPRALLLKFNNVEKRTEILKLRNLTFKDSEKSIQIYINPDRTYNERMQHKKARDELKARRDEGEENLLIRNGKVVKYQPFRFDPQSDWV